MYRFTDSKNIKQIYGVLHNNGSRFSMVQIPEDFPEKQFFKTPHKTAIIPRHGSDKTIAEALKKAFDTVQYNTYIGKGFSVMELGIHGWAEESIAHHTKKYIRRQLKKNQVRRKTTSADAIFRS